MSTLISLEEIYAPVEKSLNRVPETILSILKSQNNLSTDVIDYFFSAKGKLLRPALTLLGASVIQGENFKDDQKLTELAAAYEIFHSATLIHDDIIDSAYVRRNLPTINIKWNAQTAVLVGDFLHDRAMSVIFNNGSRTIFNRFLETAGTVCDGEIHELGVKGNFKLSENEYFEIIRKKTAVLLACALEAGALYAGAGESAAHALYEYGLKFGLAFQIIDDCLDFTGSEHEFGKTLGTDCLEGVLTLPVIRLLETSTESERRAVMDIFSKREDDARFPELLEKIKSAKTVSYSLDVAKRFNDEARAALSAIAETPAKENLFKLLDYVLERNR